MSTYFEEIGHIIGSIGTTIHHIANLLSITANRMTGDDKDEEPHPDGDNFAQVEHAGQYERTELHADANRESHDNDDGGVYRLGFNTKVNP